VVDAKARRLYQIIGDARRTAVQSFDLDNLAPRRRAVFEGSALSAGISNTLNSGNAGEPAHALDEVSGRLYLALRDDFPSGSAYTPNDFVGANQNTASPDGQSAMSRFVAIDGAAFDRCAGESGCAFASSFRAPPTGAEHHSAWLRTMAVLPDPDGGPGRLAVTWTTANHIFAPQAHQVTVWDTTGAQLRADATSQAPTSYTAGVTEVPGSRQVLTDCGASSMTFGASGSNDGTYQWGLLARPEGLWLGCQAARGSGKVVFVPWRDGVPDPTRARASFPLSQPVGDVIIDPGSGRLLLKSTGLKGVTWWTFDTGLRRYTGSVAAVLDRQVKTSTGLDPATGRLYVAFADYTLFNSARSASVKGGLFSSDTRLDPVPALESRDPGLGTKGVWRITVDPVTRRLFYRVGTAAGLEPFWRVLKDTRPIAEQPPDQDDRRFTVDTAEAPGRTKASYLGSASGYGARTVLTGGLAAATDRDRAKDSGSACTTGDRELALGRVESAALSDLSAAGTAASVAGDPDTEEQSDAPVNRCWPEAIDMVPGTSAKDRPTNPLDGGRVVDTKAVDFDTTGPKNTPDGVSDYRTQCVGDDDPAVRRPPEKAGLSEDGLELEADVDCDQAHERLEAHATASARMAVAHPDATRPPVAAVNVGYANSTVDVRRRPGGGLVAGVDSVARDVEIEGVGRIGVVRTTAVSEAAGRGGTARADFDRWICGVDLPALGLVQASCLGPDQQQQLVETFNRVFSGQAEMRLRNPDPKLERGSPSGYSAAVQRDRIDLFYDRTIVRDNSLAVPGLEIVFFRGDDINAGAGRQVLQLAAVQAGTSYGIACLYGQGRDGTCSGPVDDEVHLGSDGDDGGYSDDDSGAALASGGDDGFGPDGTAASATGGGHSLIRRLVDLPRRLVADVLRLLFSNPRELGLMAAVWALLYAPCYLGERRRALGAVGSRRLAGAG
jgi:hypothetical protein